MRKVTAVVSDAGNGFLEVIAESPLTGKVNSMRIPGTMEAYEAWVAGKGLIQELFHLATAAQREFLMTGYTQEDWDTMFPPEENDE